MALLEKAADRLLSMVAPKKEAAAACNPYCWWQQIWDGWYQYCCKYPNCDVVCR
ncbi:hypothetical protein ACIBH1_47655 [Nonomuraea sp. NPDC050663]|uniref:hypothetical protein n=1 Tax=Nonomuraea sp. NPDC050663 TaxID=3364370 RepID=UPI00379FF35C